MSLKLAKITDVLNEKPYDGQHGRLYYYDLVLDNGDKGNSGTKTRDSFTIGDELIYTITDSQYGPKIKRATKEEAEEFRSRNGNSNGEQPLPQPKVYGGGRGSDASFAASYAKDLVIKAMDTRNYAHPDDPVSFNAWVDAMLVTADKIHGWMKERA